MTTLHTHTPTCPRCGYDLTGQLDAWTTAGQCQLTCRCSECGLAASSSEVFGAQLRPPKWSFEHAGPGFARVLIALARTSVRALTPRRLFGGVGRSDRVTMAHPVVWKRLCALWLLLPLVVYFGIGLTTVLEQLWTEALSPLIWQWRFPASAWRRAGSTLSPMSLLIDLVWPYRRLSTSSFGLRAAVSVMSWTLAPALAYPVAIACLRPTMRSFRIRPTHHVRAATLCFPACVVLMVLLATLPFVLEDMINRFSYEYSRSTFRICSLSLAALTQILTALWFHTYLSTYLRIGAAWRVTLGVGLIVALLSFALMLAITPTMVTFLLP